MESNIDNHLVVQSLNFHGNQLTGFFKDLKEFRSLSLRDVDYKLYHSRSKQLRTEDRGRRLLLHRFITQSFHSLFRKNQTAKNEVEHDNREDISIAIIPPMETFCRTSGEDRTTHFFDLIQVYDVLFCRIAAKNVQGILMSILGFAPNFGKSRYIRDLKHKAFCPSEEILPNHASYEKDDIICVYVLEVKKESQRLLVSMKANGIHDEVVKEKLKDVKFGRFEEERLPVVFDYTEQVLDRRLTYSEVLEKNPGFQNPSNIDILCQEFGLSNQTGDSSLFSSLQFQFDPKKKSSALRKRQAHNMSGKHVVAGIKYFRNGSFVEAFQCLNQALQIDPENVEGLVGRGALYANKGNLETAIKDFEEALKVDETHKNARKYMCETLMALARENEDDGKEDEAVKIYERILKINPQHSEAQNAIKSIKGIHQEAQELGIDLKAFGGNKEMADKFREFIKAEKAKKELKRQELSPKKPDRLSRSPEYRSTSPFSKKVTLVNPESLMAPGAPSTSAQANIVTENIAVDPLEETPDFSVPPPNYFPKEKSTEELEYEKKVAAFLQRNIAKKDDLDDKIDKHLDGGKPGRKRRKFTDYPEPSSSSGQVQKQPETRTVKKLSPSKDSGIVYDSVIGMYKKIDTSPVRVVKKVSRSPSPPPHKRSRSRRRSRSRSRTRSRSKDRRGHQRRSRSRERRSRSRDRRSPSLTTRYRKQRKRDSRSPSPQQQRRRSRSPQHHRRRSPSPQDHRRRSPSPQNHRRRSPNPQQHQRSRSPGRHYVPPPQRRPHNNLNDLMSETERIQKERQKIQREKEELLRQSKKSSSQDSSLCLPRPVPIRTGVAPSTSSGSSSKRERKEISMKIRSGGKVLEKKIWEEMDDYDELDDIEKTMESVKKAADQDDDKGNKRRLDPAVTANRILPGAKNFQDIQKYVNQAKKDKMDKLKKNNKW